MLRVVLPAVVFLAFMGVWLFALFDVIATDEMLIRNLPNKIVWLVVVVLLWTVGAVAWLMLGRPAGAGFTPGSTATRPTRSWQQPDRPSRRPRGPEDRDDWRPGTRPSEPGHERPDHPESE